jgi:hypothetical protein
LWTVKTFYEKINTRIEANRLQLRGTVQTARPKYYFLPLFMQLAAPICNNKKGEKNDG